VRLRGAALLAALGAAGASAWFWARAARSKPDVLLVTVDTLRADHLGVYGFAYDTSPNLDALARRGVVFERGVAASSRTVPSHASILTSRWVRQHSVGFGNGSTRLVDAPTLAEAFQAAGYETAAMVSNEVLRRRTGLDRGFDVYDDDLTTEEANRRMYYERVAEDTTRRAMEWLIAQGERPSPVFLWVHYQDPHGPYTPPAAYDRFTVEPEGADEVLPVLSNVSGLGGIPSYQAVPGESRVGQYLSRYAGEIRYFDHWLGELLQAFETSGTSRPRVILLTGDHGESLGEEGYYFAHGHGCGPDLAHVPFILVAPGIPPGRRDEPVSHVDVAPTLLALAGLPALEKSTGTALGPYLESGDAIPDRTLLCDAGFGGLAAYRGPGFLRLTFALDLEAKRTTFSAARYRWGEGGAWRREEERVPFPAWLAEYVQDAVPVAPAPPLDAATVERLRALGYVAPGEAAGD
jgi:arylsulfatase